MNEPSLSATSAAMTSAPVKASTTSAMESASTVKAAETRLPARGESPSNSSMIKAAERAGMTTRLGMRCRRSVLRSYKSMLWG